MWDPFVPGFHSLSAGDTGGTPASFYWEDEEPLPTSVCRKIKVLGPPLVSTPLPSLSWSFTLEISALNFKESSFNFFCKVLTSFVCELQRRIQYN